MKGDILVVCSKKLNVEQVLAKNRISVFFSYVVKYHILYIDLESNLFKNSKGILSSNLKILKISDFPFLIKLFFYLDDIGT